MVLGTTDEETLKLVQKRLDKQRDDMEMTDALLQVDDAIQVIDKYDHDKLREAKQAAEHHHPEHKEFFLDLHCEGPSGQGREEA
eukprot:2044377-Alexandrium_andersonii.AAC.1